MQSLKQDQALEIITRCDKSTASDVAKQMRIDVKAAGAHLRRLEALGKIYVSEWVKGKYGALTKAYTAGKGISVVHISPRRKPKEPKPPKEDLFDGYIAQNNGWQSRIITQDPRMNHSDHIRFMNSFRPQADVAAQWLFK